LIFGDGGAVTLAGIPLSLTKGELAILRCLSVSNGAPVSRETLAALLGGGGNIVDVYICKLRTKIEKPLGRRIIHTERGVGYRMDSSLFG
jgi:DNA-binding response OmpR family regulator